MHKLRTLWLFIALLPVTVLAQSSEQKSSAQLERLRARLQTMADGFPGLLGVGVRNIRTGEEVSVNGDKPFPMASAYKIPILVEVYRQAEAGKFSLDDRVEVGDNERTLGSGVLTLLSNGQRPTIRDLATLMIILSDNEATDILLKKVGAANVTATMRAFGLQNIRVDRTTFELIRDYLVLMDARAKDKSYKEIVALSQSGSPATQEQVTKAEYEFGRILKDVSSPVDMSRLLDKIYKGEAASAKGCQEMLRILGLQQFNHRLPRYLPDSARMQHKTGTIGSTTNDAGIMYVRGLPVAITVFTMDKRVSRTEVEEYMGRVAKVVYDFYDFSQP